MELFTQAYCAGRIEEWRTRWTEQLEGVPTGGFALAPDVPVVAIASDLQEVTGWPRCMHSFLEADWVITPTRVLGLEI